MSLTSLYQCFSHPDRVRIVALLRERPLCVQELQSVLRLSQVEVSKHLAYLRRAGLVVSAVSGTWRVYRLRDDLSFELVRHLRCLRECIDHAKLLQQEFERLRALPLKPNAARAKAKTGRAVEVSRAEVAPGQTPSQAGANLTALEDHLL